MSGLPRSEEARSAMVCANSPSAVANSVLCQNERRGEEGGQRDVERWATMGGESRDEWRSEKGGICYLVVV